MNVIKHWKLTRLLSLPLVPLFVYFLTQAQYLTTKSRMEVISWIKTPSATLALLVFIVCGFWHAQLGMEEIIIDYIPAEKAQKLALCLNKLAFLILGLVCAAATLAITFGTH